MFRNASLSTVARPFVHLVAAAFLLLPLARPAQAQNLVGNAELDFDIDGWAVNLPSISDLEWREFDATECEALSGSALATNFSIVAAGSSYFTTCVPGLTAGETYSFGGLLRFVTGQAQTGYGKFLMRWMDEDDCEGNIIDLADSDGVVDSSTAGAWVASGNDAAVAPAGTQSATLGVFLVKDSHTGTLEMRFDSVFFVPRAGFLFADDFEIDSSCRWSSEMP